MTATATQMTAMKMKTMIGMAVEKTNTTAMMAVKKMNIMTTTMKTEVLKKFNKAIYVLSSGYFIDDVSIYCGMAL